MKSTSSSENPGLTRNWLTSDVAGKNRGSAPPGGLDPRTGSGPAKPAMSLMAGGKRRLMALLRFVHRRLAVEQVLVLGDSHAAVFRHWQFSLKYPDKFFRVYSVYGATASGLENPNSKTQAYEVFAKALESERFSKLVVMLGEVDTGFVIWYRAQKYGVPVSQMFDQAVSKYTRFLCGLSSKGRKLIVVSTPLPTIQDGIYLGDIANLRKEVTATQRERTELTLRFNLAIEDYCKTHGLSYIGTDRECLGQNGLVRDDLLNPDPTDHHYDRRKYASLLANAIKNAI